MTASSDIASDMCSGFHFPLMEYLTTFTHTFGCTRVDYISPEYPQNQQFDTPTVFFYYFFLLRIPTIITTDKKKSRGALKRTRRFVPCKTTPSQVWTFDWTYIKYTFPNVYTL